MKKKYLDFFTLLGILLLILFRNSFNKIIISFSNNYDFKNLYQNTCKEIINDNDNLKKIIDFESTSDINYITSKVNYRDILGFTDEVQIFKGSNDGIKSNMAVINELGLVGVVKSVDKETSQVELITSKNSNVSVKVNDSYGILKYLDDKLVVANITNLDDVSIDSDIYTSGLGNLPGGIYIGRVRDVIKNSTGISKTLIVDPAVDFNNLIYLLVIPS